MVHFLPPFHTFQRLRTWTPSVPSWAELVAAGRRHGTSLRPAAWPGKATGGRIRWTRRSNGDISILIIFNTSFTLYTLYTLYIIYIIHIYINMRIEREIERERHVIVTYPIISHNLRYPARLYDLQCAEDDWWGEVWSKNCWLSVGWSVVFLARLGVFYWRSADASVTGINLFFKILVVRMRTSRSKSPPKDHS